MMVFISGIMNAMTRLVNSWVSVVLVGLGEFGFLVVLAL